MSFVQLVDLSIIMQCNFSLGVPLNAIMQHGTRSKKRMKKKQREEGGKREIWDC